MAEGRVQTPDKEEEVIPKKGASSVNMEVVPVLNAPIFISLFISLPHNNTMKYGDIGLLINCQQSMLFCCINQTEGGKNFLYYYILLLKYTKLKKKSILIHSHNQ